MIQGNFHRYEAFKPIGPSKSQFCFVVEALHRTGGDGFFGPKPIQQKRSMLAERRGHFFHGVYFGAHGAGTPIVEKPPRPKRREVVPKESEVLLEEVGPHCLEVVFQQFGQLEVLVRGSVRWALEQTPAGPFQNGAVTIGLELPGFGGPHLVEGLVHVGDDVKPVENMQGLARFFGDGAQIGPPHIAANKAQAGAAPGAEPMEKGQQGLYFSIRPDPQQPLAVGIDLVDHRQIAVPAFPQDLVHADGGDVIQLEMGSSPGNRHGHRAEHGIPTGLKDLGGFGPTEPLGPAGQEPSVDMGQAAFALRPGNRFNLHAATRTRHAPHRIMKKYPDTPQRHELESAGRGGVVTRSPFLATRADRFAALAGADGHLEFKSTVGFNHHDSRVNESGVFLNPIQDSLDAHPVALLEDDFYRMPSFQVRSRDALTLSLNHRLLCHAPSAHRRPGYPLQGCVSAEPYSVFPGIWSLRESSMMLQLPSDTGAMP